VSRVLLRKLRRDLLSHKIALAALLVIIAIGVGCYAGMAGVYRDMEGARRRYYTGYRLAHFSVDLKRAPEWAVRALERLPNVRAVRGRVNLAVRVSLPNEPHPISGIAIGMPVDRRPVLNDVLLRSGAWFSGRRREEVILNEAFARVHGLVPGSRIRAVFLDGEHDLLVVGTALSPEFVYVMPPGGGLAPDPARTGVLYLPEDFLRRTCDLEGAWNQVVGLAHDASRPALERTLRLIEERLDAFGVTNTTPIQEQPSARFLRDELDGLKITARVIPAVFLGVAALVLNILMGRMVAQQRAVIGTLRALGYSAGALLRHYLGFGLIVGAAGGLLGLGFGWWIQARMLDIYREFYVLPDFTRHFYPGVHAVGFAVSLVFAVGGTLKAVRTAARLHPAEAMRPPPPERGGRVPVERIPWLWRRLSFGGKMVLRTVFRNPFRSAVGVGASFISTTLIFGVLSNVAALDHLMTYEFARVMHQDVTLSLRDPAGRRGVSEAARFPRVTGVEAQLAVVCDLAHGPRRRRVAVSGLVRDHRLITPLDARGRPIVVPDEGLVLTRKLAEVLAVRVGDTVRLRPLIGERREAAAPVVGVVESYLGLSAYADIAYLSRLLGEAWSANVLLATGPVGEAPEPFLAALRRRPVIIGLGERERALSQMRATFGETMGTMIAVMVLFAGMIAFGSVLNAALVSLSERQREVGTLRVLGYGPGRVARIFSAESALLNGVGIVLGLAGGVGFAHLISRAYDTELYRFPVVITADRFFVVAALMAAFVGVAELIIYRLVCRLPWLEVLSVRE